MDIRNVQKTGNMHYIYLPTSWCRKHKITSDSKVSVGENNEGSLSIFPDIKEKAERNIVINVNENNLDVIHKLIVACFINPTTSFRINFGKDINSSALLNQRRLISLENVDITNKQVSCESVVSISDPASLLRTMVRKIKNLLVIMADYYEKDIVERYEEEIDKCKLLIDKCAVSAFTFSSPLKMKMIELYYVSIIARELERIVDNIILLGKNDKKIVEASMNAINSLKDMLETAGIGEQPQLGHSTAIDFVKKVIAVEEAGSKGASSYTIKNISNSFVNISDVIMDWAITNQINE